MRFVHISKIFGADKAWAVRQKCEPIHSVVFFFFFVVVILIPCKYLIETGKREKDSGNVCRRAKCMCILEVDAEEKKNPKKKKLLFP